MRGQFCFQAVSGSQQRKPDQCPLTCAASRDPLAGSLAILSVPSPMTEPLRTPAPRPGSAWRERWHDIIFEADTREGKLFDVVLLVAICISIVAVSLDSVADIAKTYRVPLHITEWVLTVFFTIEYILRLMVVRRPLAYARSFFGIVDLLAVLPTYLSFFFTGSHALLVIRAFRLLRIFRIFKAARYVTELNALMRALKDTRHKIAVFLFTVLTAVLIMGTLLYVVEGADAGFTSIPRSVYWAIVTMTTVGYGDIAPQTPLGQLIAACAMILGYGLIIIPIGLFAVELAQGPAVTTTHCSSCSREGHAPDAIYCKYCGEKL